MRQLGDAMFRTLFLIAAAFLAGIFYERSGQNGACVARGGEMSENLCLGVEE